MGGWVGCWSPSGGAARWRKTPCLRPPPHAARPARPAVPSSPRQRRRTRHARELVLSVHPHHAHAAADADQQVGVVVCGRHGGPQAVVLLDHQGESQSRQEACSRRARKRVGPGPQVLQSESGGCAPVEGRSTNVICPFSYWKASWRTACGAAAACGSMVGCRQRLATIRHCTDEPPRRLRPARPPCCLPTLLHARPAPAHPR